MLKGSNKGRLKELQKRLSRLVGELPGEARALVEDVTALQEDIHDRLGPFVLKVSARECADFGDRLKDLNERADRLQALREEVVPVLRAEEAFAAGLNRLDDPELRQLFADLGIERRAGLVALGREEPEADPTQPGGDSIGDLRGWGQGDREVFNRFVKARERLRSVRAEARVRNLREALPRLQRRFIELRPGLDKKPRDEQRAGGKLLTELLTELQGLLDPLDKFHKRDKPEHIDQVQQQIMTIAGWIEVLSAGDDDGTAGNPMARFQNAHQSLTGTYWELTEKWQDHEDEVFDALYDRADALMRELTVQAEQEHAKARSRLDRNREIYDQYGDPEINPGLAEEMAELLVQTPDAPYEFGDWLERYRRASQEFAEALGGDAHQLLDICGQVRTGIGESLSDIRKLALTRADDSELVTLESELDAAKGTISDGAPIEAVIDSLNLHRNLAERIDALHARALEKAKRLSADRDAVRDRAERLGTLAGALGVPLPPASILPREIEPGLAVSIELGYQSLERERDALAGVEPDLVSECCDRLGERLAAMRDVRAQLDEDLDIRGDGLPAAGLDSTPSTLEEAEALLSGLDPVHQLLQDALERQLERLRRRRTSLLQPSTGRARGRHGTDHDLLDDLLHQLRDLDEGLFGDRLGLVRQLRYLVGQVELQIRRIERDEKAIVALRSDVDDRLSALAREFPELKSTPYHDRARSLIKEVRVAAASREALYEQIRRADELLRPLERHARRLVAHKFARDLKAISGIKDADRSDLDAWLQQPDRHLELPDAGLRQQAMDLVKRHPPAP